VWQSAFAPHHATLFHTAPPRALWRHGRTHARVRALLVGWPEVATIWALRGHIKRSTQLSYVDSYLPQPDAGTQGSGFGSPRPTRGPRSVVIFTKQSHLFRAKSS
jgi:hypothetical protein